jgi:hypothetical protein
MQTLELLRENLEILYQAVDGHPESSLIEEHGKPEGNDFFAVYELNDELFLFHFARNTISQLIVFESVPDALKYLRSVTQS